MFLSLKFKFCERQNFGDIIENEAIKTLCSEIQKGNEILDKVQLKH